MNAAQFDDLKQLIDTTATRTEINIEKKLTGEIRKTENRLIQRIDNGFAGVADAFDGITAILDNHEHRITSLEQAK